MTPDGKPVVQGWEIEDGAIHLKKDGKKAGNIVTTHEYADFDLSFEWKIAAKGNSGIKYRVRSYGGKVLGCEYQIYDDKAAKTSAKSKNGSGALYDLYEPNDAKKLKPVGEYNTARIVVKGQQIEHWLNGAKIVSATVGDAEWKRRVASSKFSDVADFALEPQGRIMLTDHGSEVWYRNFTFTGTPLTPKPSPPPLAARKPTPTKAKPLTASQALKETFVYKEAGDLKIKADVEIAGGDAPRPVVVWIHGGGLINGHRESVMPWIREAFLPRGYAIVSIDYRLAPESKLEDIVADVEDAIAWVRTVGPRAFGADPKRIAVAGGSAGGFLTLVSGFRVDPAPQALVALWGYGDLGAPWTYEASRAPRHDTTPLADDELSKLLSGPAVSDSRERAGNGAAYYQYVRRTGGWAEAVSGWNPKSRPAKFFPYMPERNVSADYPPTLLIHGDADTDVPYDSSARMAEQFKQHKVPHHLIRFEGGEHGLGNSDKEKVAAAYEAAAKFIIERLEKK
jgi:acetyl esterase/lipase